MDFSQLLIEFLKIEERASVPGFGVFSVKTANAVVEEQHILPPRQEIFFSNETGETDKNFVEFLARKKKLSLLAAEDEIRKQVTFWSKTLEKEGLLYMKDIGTFYLDDSKILFKDDRTENSAPDYYGLEQIDLAKIKKPRHAQNGPTTHDYGFSKYWVLPLLIGVFAITYLGISQPETLFGKKSFGEDLGKKPTSKTNGNAVKSDSLMITEQDSSTVEKK